MTTGKTSTTDRLRPRAGTDTTIREDRQESCDAYAGVVAQLSPDYRVIKCRARVQWVLQKRRGTRNGRPRWLGKGYFTTKAPLIEKCRQVAPGMSAEAHAALENLPRKIGAGGNDR